jgi:hypothetical protein
MLDAELKRLIERRQRVPWWGQPTWITPRLVAERFGDGKQPIGLAPIDYRPNHFIVRIDSLWNVNNHARDCELLIDHLDEIYDSIELEYPDWPWYEEYGLRLDMDRGDEFSSATDFSCGSAWWNEEWPNDETSFFDSAAAADAIEALKEGGAK